MQRWHHHLTLQRMQLDQQLEIQQRLDLVEQNHLSLEEQQCVELDIQQAALDTAILLKMKWI